MVLTQVTQNQTSDFWGAVVPAWLTVAIALATLIVGVVSASLLRYLDRRSKPVIARRHAGDRWTFENRMRTPMVNIRYSFQDANGNGIDLPGWNPSMLRGRQEMGLSVPNDHTLTMNWDEIRRTKIRPGRVTFRPRAGSDEYVLPRRPLGVANG